MAAESLSISLTMQPLELPPMLPLPTLLWSDRPLLLGTGLLPGGRRGAHRGYDVVWCGWAEGACRVGDFPETVLTRQAPFGIESLHLLIGQGTGKGLGQAISHSDSSLAIRA